MGLSEIRANRAIAVETTAVELGDVRALMNTKYLNSPAGIQAYGQLVIKIRQCERDGERSEIPDSSAPYAYKAAYELYQRMTSRPPPRPDASAVHAAEYRDVYSKYNLIIPRGKALGFLAKDTQVPSEGNTQAAVDRIKWEYSDLWHKIDEYNSMSPDQRRIAALEKDKAALEHKVEKICETLTAVTKHLGMIEIGSSNTEESNGTPSIQ